MASKSKAAKKHYLVTVSTRERVSFHGYLMSREDRTVDVAVKLMDMAEKDDKLTPWGIVLMTNLASDGIACVRDILTRNSPEVAAKLKAAKNFHISIFVMADNHPDAPKLMALH